MTVDLERPRPDISVGSLFEDAHQAARLLVEAIDAIRFENGIDSNRFVPGYDLFIDKNHGS